MKIINLENSDILQNNFIDIKDTYVVKKGEDKNICEFSYDIGIKSNKKRAIQKNVFYEKKKIKCIGFHTIIIHVGTILFFYCFLYFVKNI